MASVLHIQFFFQIGLQAVMAVELYFTSDEDTMDADDFNPSYDTCPDDVKLVVRYGKLWYGFVMDFKNFVL
jgi:hypothetical protein